MFEIWFYILQFSFVDKYTNQNVKPTIIYILKRSYTFRNLNRFNILNVRKLIFVKIRSFFHIVIL